MLSGKHIHALIDLLSLVEFQRKQTGCEASLMSVEILFTDAVMFMTASMVTYCMLLMSHSPVPNFFAGGQLYNSPETPCSRFTHQISRGIINKVCKYICTVLCINLIHKIPKYFLFIHSWKCNEFVVWQFRHDSLFIIIGEHREW